MFEELRSDEQAIERFVTEQNARTNAALRDAAFEADVVVATEVMSHEDTLNGLMRRGDWVYTFRKTTAHPRGRWLRRPFDAPITPDAEWDVAFDLDAYCAETETDWHWAGAPTCPGAPHRVLIQLSQGGSDQRILREFDTDAGAFVDGGFSFGPERGHVIWADIDTVLWSSALPGDATETSWPGTVRRVRRGQNRKDGEVIFRAEPSDLMGSGYSISDGHGGRVECVTRAVTIGEQEITMLMPDGPLRLPTPSDTTDVHSTTHYAYIVKGDGGPKGALMLGEIGGAPAKPVMEVQERQAIAPYSVHMLDDWLVWTMMDNLVPRLFAMPLADDSVPQEIALPEPAQTMYFGYQNADPDTDETLQLHIQGFLTSPRVYTFDLANGVEGITWRKVWSEPERFDTSGLEVRLLTAVSDDGTEVPYHLVAPKDAPDDLPVLLYGYGGFNASMSPSYSPVQGALWLAKGCGYALGYIRGGGEFGPDWHKAAKRENRARAFEDFAAIASDLVQRGVTVPAKIACHGHSNGGLLTGVMLTRYPDRFGAVWTGVGVHDMLSFHSYPAGRAWIDEYGDPDDPEARDWLLAYSPLHNVASEPSYPPCFVETSASDDRVDPSHSRRFAAALLAAGQDVHFAQTSGGHGGVNSVRDRAQTTALGYSFLRHALGVDT